LVIKTLDPDWIRIGIQLKMLDPDKMNTDPKRTCTAQNLHHMQQGPPLRKPIQLPETRDFETRKDIYNKSVLKENQRRSQDAMKEHRVDIQCHFVLYFSHNPSKKKQARNPDPDPSRLKLFPKKGKIKIIYV
jgi:hypothetical protein